MWGWWPPGGPQSSAEAEGPEGGAWALAFGRLKVWGSSRPSKDPLAPSLLLHLYTGQMKGLKIITSSELLHCPLPLARFC